jgi:CheY-like chemotaxis protein
MKNNLRVLAIDDEKFNLDIMQEYFEEARFDSVTAQNGIDALNILKKDNGFDVIVLDRLMPKMDGIEFVKKVKSNEDLQNIPVIMQTAASTSKQIAEGIKSGVFYYLSKPYSKEVFLAVIKAANDDLKRKTELQTQIKDYSHAMRMIMNGEFKFQTIDDARLMGMLIGGCLPDPVSMTAGLTELAINAVEHGNLEITYQEKTKLRLESTWEEEINKRLSLPQYKSKVCSLTINRGEKEIIIRIKDQGAGFDWQKFTAFNPARLTDLNGRGILMSNNCGFTSVNYLGNGNEVECKITI